MATNSLKVPDPKAALKSSSKTNTVKPAPLQKQGSSSSLGKGTAGTRSKSKLGSVSMARLKRESQRRFDDDGGEEDWEAKDPVKPVDQLQLTDPELGQEFTRIINANNPHAPDNIVRFSYKDKEFKQTSTVDHTAFHFTLDGSLLLVDSDEGRRQKSRKSMALRSKSRTSVAPESQAVAAAVAVTASTATGGDDDEDGGPSEKRGLRNQFNYSERASQTSNATIKERSAQTEPPPRAVFGATATQWSIYDAYIADQARQAALKEKKVVAKKEGPKEKAADASEVLDRNDEASPWAAAGRLVKLTDAKKLERMINQNTYDEVIQDLYYYEDPSDEFKPGQGSLLPLWRMACASAKKRAVTALAWSSQYADLFAVGYGSYDYLRQTGGLIAVFSLKNPSFPEFDFETPSGVMCLDIHPKKSDLLVVGLYDGTVCVHRLRYGGGIGTPLYQSTAKTGKHSDPVWQVKWQLGEDDSVYSFASVSSDGRVASWTIVKNELQCADMILLQSEAELGTGSTSVFGRSCGTCMAFSPAAPGTFLVGTEDGPVRACSTAYGSKYLRSFLGHGMAVYNIAWNVFHPRVFITCGADWTVRVWDNACTEAIFSFDLGSPVGDVAWAPFSSCVFAAVTTNGQIYVFDLAQNKYEPLCVQDVVRKRHLTHIAFNDKLPLIIVGDDGGSVHNLKLSPNLRKITRDKKAQAPEAQIAALEKILDSVKDLPA